MAREQADAAALQRFQVTFKPGARVIEMPAGCTLLEAAQAADIHLNASCNGKGLCGKCKLVVESGQIESERTALLSDAEKQKRYVLACQSRLHGDAVVRIPAEAIERKLKVTGMGRDATERLQGLVAQIDPMLREIPLELSPPTIEDAVSDVDRLNRGLKQRGCDIERLYVGLDVLRQLAGVMRAGQWKVTASVVRRRRFSELVDVRPGNGAEASLGLAIDVGTTTIVVYLVDMADGNVRAATSGHNRQAACGDDVINRIVCAEKDGIHKLNAMALATINGLVGEALDSAGVQASQVRNVVVAGNTVMTHLLLQIEPRYIRRAPYIPTVAEFPILKAGEIGFKTHPAAAVFVMPGPASYVGGDIVAGMLFAGFQREAPLTLFIDVGTNGEIVLGHREWLMTAACSAGPAFEGGGIQWGMRAEQGAIERVVIDRETLAPEVATVGGEPPRGICGSGMIDVIAELLAAGIVDRSGRFARDLNHPRVRKVRDEWSYLLVSADRTPAHEDIVFTESDLRNLIYSKGAVYAGFTTLLKEAGLEFADVDRVLIAGGFGQYLNVDQAVRIGLLPDIDRGKFSYLGNSSIAGAYLALLSDTHRREAREICRAMTYVDFSSNPRYMDEFTSSLFLPHTHLEKFPSVV
ncbi:MAG: ASKHA domain-containing protein [Desulfobacterales bacterium]